MKKIIIIMLVCTSNVLFTQQTIDTDRPDQTESSSAVPAGVLQLENGLTATYTDDSTSQTKNYLLPTIQMRYGITKHFELRVLSQFEANAEEGKTQFGMSNLEVGTKIQLFKKETNNTEVAFVSHVVLPIGSKGFNNDMFGTFNKLCISHSFDKGLSLGYNLGYNNYEQNDGDFTYTLALAKDVNDKVGIYIEPYGEYSNLEEWVINADAGMTYLLSPNVQFDFSFGIGLNNRMNYMSVGLSWMSKQSKFEEK